MRSQVRERINGLEHVEAAFCTICISLVAIGNGNVLLLLLCVLHTPSNVLLIILFTRIMAYRASEYYNNIMIQNNVNRDNVINITGLLHA